MTCMYTTFYLMIGLLYAFYEFPLFLFIAFCAQLFTNYYL